MKIAVGCDLAYEVADITTFIFNVAVAQISQHAQVGERWIVEPAVPAETIIAGLDNRYTRLVARNGTLRLRYEAALDLQLALEDPNAIDETPVEDLPLDMFPFLMPSRFCPSDRLAEFAEREFAALPRGHGRVTAICNWICDNIAYRPGASDPFTSAAETLQHRAGVCRDFAHLGISFCRALNIPARLVSCYATGLEPPDFHAMFEAYLDGRWWLFDPTRQARLDGIVRIGTGRDAAEVSFASMYGKARMTDMTVWAQPADEAAVNERPVAAVG
ncbi:MAG: transglutaminase family protein [Pseudorhodoplanes sp.]|uniref:transglutaminase-like domain-containing protein n=1 Tax=Pseudorhodoplanes sp. TaxID=1934341 RepID=UPI003D0D28EC